jgi:hypothetical protein
MFRRTIAAALCTAAAVFCVPAVASAATTIQPGAYHSTSVGSCTLNFIYDGGGKTYAGTAAHCVSKIGEPVKDIDGATFGTVAYIGDQNTTARDYAFIEVNAASLSRVSAGVKGWPQFPKGSTVPADAKQGDQIQLSGYGLGFGTTKSTQENRKAVFDWNDASTYDVAGPIDWGDSGGPLVHIATGKALGIVSRLCVGILCTEEGPTVQGILADASAHGFPVTLRTV